MTPAIKLAREGFILNRADTDILNTTVSRFKNDPEVARIFLRKDGTPLQPGDRLVQKDLARTLAAIARRGPDAFYQGALPAAVEAAARKLILLTCGTYGNVIRILVPLTASDALLDEGMAIIAECFDAAAAGA